MRPLLQLLSQLLAFYSVLIIVRALLSWVHPDPRNPIMRLLHKLTEPVLAPLRRLVPPGFFGGLDFSPVLAFLLITLANRVLAALY